MLTAPAAAERAAPTGRMSAPNSSGSPAPRPMKRVSSTASNGPSGSLLTSALAPPAPPTQRPPRTGTRTVSPRLALFRRRTTTSATITPRAPRRGSRHASTPRPAPPAPPPPPAAARARQQVRKSPQARGHAERLRPVHELRPQHVPEPSGRQPVDEAQSAVPRAARDLRRLARRPAGPAGRRLPPRKGRSRAPSVMLAVLLGVLERPPATGARLPVRSLRAAQ